MYCHYVILHEQNVELHLETQEPSQIRQQKFAQILIPPSRFKVISLNFYSLL